MVLTSELESLGFSSPGLPSFHFVQSLPSRETFPFWEVYIPLAGHECSDISCTYLFLSFGGNLSLGVFLEGKRDTSYLDLL